MSNLAAARQKCKDFLLNNGYTEYISDPAYLSFEHISKSVSLIDILEEEIVFISDEGDWLHIPINYYALIGSLIHFSQIGIGYKH